MLPSLDVRLVLSTSKSLQVAPGVWRGILTARCNTTELWSLSVFLAGLETTSQLYWRWIEAPMLLHTKTVQLYLLLDYGHLLGFFVTSEVGLTC
jgi:hypothetical protein